MRWTPPLSKCIFAVCLIPMVQSLLLAEVVYTNPADFTVRGGWTPAGDNILVEPDEAALDVNNDGIVDAHFSHDFRLRPNRLSSDSYELITTAINGIYASYDLLLDIRTVTIPAASNGLLTDEEYLTSMARVSNAIDTMNRVANNIRYADRPLLNGDSGIDGTTSSRDVTFLKGTADTEPGSYHLDVVQAGRRATVLSSAPMQGPLGQDEILTINGIAVELFEDMSQTHVRDRLNEYSRETGVTASIVAAGNDAGSLRLSTVQFGSAAELSVVSNVADWTPDSTWFGNTIVVAAGEDIIVNVDGIQYTGRGDTVTVEAGPARGLAFTVREDWGDAAHQTVDGVVGSISVIDSALQLGLLPDGTDHVRVALPSLHSQALGLGVAGNRFNGLSEIDITSSSKAQDALEIIDTSIEEVRLAMANTSAVLDDHYFPFAVLTAEGKHTTQLLTDESGAALKLTVGDSIDPEGTYGTGAFTVDEESFGNASTAYFGLRLLIDDNYHYGWIRGTLGNDNELTIHDYAFESSHDESIRAGLVPEPMGLGIPALVVLLSAASSRQRGTMSHHGID